MTNSWDEMAKAKEEQFFKKLNDEALERYRLRAESSDNQATPRKHPDTGEALVQRVLYGAVIDYCPVTGGMWLDAGELEIMIKNAQEADAHSTADFSFIKHIGQLLKLK